MKLSIIIPVYNEEETVGKVVKKTKNLKLPFEKEIIVVDDGSKDDSYDIISKLKGIKTVRHEKNLGKGAAVRTGLQYVKGDYFIIQDADLELDPSEILKVIKPVINGKADVVYGSRNIYVKKKDRSPLFYFGGKFVTFVTNLLYRTNITDEPCGYKLFKTEIVKELGIKADGFEWEPEITAKIAKKGVKIHEVAIDAGSRSLKEGKKLRRMDGVKAVLTLFRHKFIS